MLTARPAGRLQVDELRGGRASSSAGGGGGEYDRFRSRIMFPIRDRRGRALGFGGAGDALRPGGEVRQHRRDRLLPQEPACSTAIDQAKAAIAKAGRAVVVEGYTDVLALHQAGIEEAVGVMGTAITEEQVAALSGMVEEVVLALDADSAGQEAMLRAQRVAAGRRMRLRVAAMPAGRGPGRDDGRRGRGGALPGAARGRGRAARVPGRAGARAAPTSASPAERDRALAEVAPVLAAMGEIGEPRRPGAAGGGAARPRAGDGDAAVPAAARGRRRAGGAPAARGGRAAARRRPPATS